MTISHMTAKDVPHLVNIDKMIYDDQAWCSDSFRTHFRTASMVGLVARVGFLSETRPAGYVSAIVQKSGIYIARMVVHPDDRRQGIGTALFESLQLQLRCMNKPIYYLLSDAPEASDWFTIGQDFLRRNGFMLLRVARNISKATCQDGTQEDKLRSVYHFVHAVKTTA